MTFEEWKNGLMPGLNGKPTKRRAFYSPNEWHVMHTAWKAADRNAREECAKICEQYRAMAYDPKRPVLSSAAKKARDDILNTIKEKS